MRRWRPHFPFHFYCDVRNSEDSCLLGELLRSFGRQQCCHNLTRPLEPEDTGHHSPRDTAPHSRRWLFPSVRCCIITYVLLALFSYAVSTDVVVIYNVRFRNDYGCRICKGFAGSGCGPLHGTASVFLEALKSDAEPRGVAFHVWSSWSLSANTCSATFGVFIVETSYVSRVRVRECHVRPEQCRRHSGLTEREQREPLCEIS